MGGFCCCFRFHVEVTEITPSPSPSSSSSSSLTHSNTNNNTTNGQYQHHADPRVLQSFPRFVPTMASKSNSAQPEARDCSSTQTCSIEIANQGTLDSAYDDCDSSEECCPTCFERYTDENPKITAECSHHFHLPCILEWQQISEECPICRRMLIVKGLLDPMMPEKRSIYLT